MKRLISFLLAVSLLLLSGCGEQQTGEGLRIYYAVSDETAYGQSALEYEQWSDAPETVTPDALFLRMMKAPEDGDHTVLFPKNTQLLSWTLENELLTLDFSERYGDLSGIALTQANYCLTLTMSQLEDVEQIAILVEGKPLPGWTQTTLRPQDALLTGEIQDPVSMGFQLYFPNNEHSDLVGDYQETEVYGSGADVQFRAVIQLLVSGPSDPNDMSSPFVGLESYLDAEWVDGICIVKLTDSWAQVLISDELALRSMVDSLCACSDISGVAFSWEGGEDGSFAGTFYSDIEP